MSYQQITLKDIAKRLNTSVSTVSRALQNNPGISEEMKKKVLKLAKELDYHPNSLAVSLLKRKTCTLGVIVPEIAHNFYSMVMEGIEDVAITAGYNVLFCMSKESQEREMNVLKTLMHARMDGLLIAPSKETTDCGHLETIFNRELPLIFFDRHCANIPASKVLIDDYGGAFKAVEHLVAAGCERIAHIAGPQNLSNGQQRLSGYMDALKKLGLETKEDLVAISDLTKESTLACTRKLLELKERPDAILAYNSFIAFESMLLVKQEGFRIPDDIAFVGFANEPVISYIEPQLTTIIQPAHEMGTAAARLFLNQVNNGTIRFSPETVILETALVVNASSRRKQDH